MQRWQRAAMTEIQFVWDHWKFNADQRIKAFNFFVIFAIFADGGVFGALEKGAHPVVFIVVGGLIVALAAAFFVIDVRSERLIRLSEPGLLAFEQTLSAPSKLFHNDAANRDSWVRYKYAMRGLMVVQAVFGVAVFGFGALAATGWVARDVFVSSVPIVSQGQATSRGDVQAAPASRTASVGAAR